VFSQESAQFTPRHITLRLLSRQLYFTRRCITLRLPLKSYSSSLYFQVAFEAFYQPLIRTMEPPLLHESLVLALLSVAPLLLYVCETYRRHNSFKGQHREFVFWPRRRGMECAQVAKSGHLTVNIGQNGFFLSKQEGTE
jgi:hypothetical protein